MCTAYFLCAAEGPSVFVDPMPAFADAAYGLNQIGINGRHDPNAIGGSK